MIDFESLIIISFPIYLILLFFIRKYSFKKIFLISAFYFYIIFLIWITFFPIPLHQVLYDLENNFIPLSSIFQLVSTNNFNIIIKQIIGNIVLFIPLWFFVSILIKDFKKALFLIFSLSLSIEIIQQLIWILIWFNYRVFDVDDIFLNLVWGVIGVLVWKMIRKKTSEN